MQENQRNVTEREMEVLQLIHLKMSDKEIGEKLHISEFTAKTHRQSLRGKFKAPTSAILREKALKEGYVPNTVKCSKFCNQRQIQSKQMQFEKQEQQVGKQERQVGEQERQVG